MAKILSPLGSGAVSGRVLSVIHQAWRGLNIVRRFTMPTIRHTDSQVARRANFGTTSINWPATLTVAQRATWNDYNPEIKDLWGNSVRATGLNMYKRVNSILIDAGKTLLTEAPLTSPMPSPGYTATFDATENKIDITKPSAPDVAEYEPFVDIWVAGATVSAEEIGGIVQVRTTGVKPSINPAKNLFRHVAFTNETDANDRPIVFKDVEGNDFMKDIKIAVLLIRCTKDGLRSTMVKATNITIDHV